MTEKAKQVFSSGFQRLKARHDALLAQHAALTSELAKAQARGESDEALRKAIVAAVPQAKLVEILKAANIGPITSESSVEADMLRSPAVADAIEDATARRGRQNGLGTWAPVVDSAAVKALGEKPHVAAAARRNKAEHERQVAALDQARANRDRRD